MPGIKLGVPGGPSGSGNAQDVRRDLDSNLESSETTAAAKGYTLDGAQAQRNKSSSKGAAGKEPVIRPSVLIAFLVMIGAAVVMAVGASLSGGGGGGSSFDPDQMVKDYEAYRVAAQAERPRGSKALPSAAEVRKELQSIAFTGNNEGEQDATQAWVTLFMRFEPDERNPVFRLARDRIRQSR